MSANERAIDRLKRLRRKLDNAIADLKHPDPYMVPIGVKSHLPHQLIILGEFIIVEVEPNWGIIEDVDNAMETIKMLSP